MRQKNKKRKGKKADQTLDNPVGKVFSRNELQKIADICLQHQIIILSDEVYDSLYYVPFTRVATLSPEVEKLTITVGSAGKNFYVTGWRVGQSLLLSDCMQYDAARSMLTRSVLLQAGS
jgi:kynurenine aminotransferase